MAAYQTQQINVGSIAAPEVGSVFTNFADRISKQQSNELYIMNQMRQNEIQAQRYAREQELNKRADVEYGKQMAVQQASKDIAKQLIDTPYAAKFGGAENTAIVDEAVLKETERRNKLGLAPFNAEEAAGIQRTYEAHRPFKEDARRSIAGILMSQGASAAQANQEAEGLTAGMISRADKQTMANQMREDQQKYYDKVADNKLELYKTLTSNDLERMKALGNSYGIGGGGSAKGGIGLSTSWDEVMSKDYNLSPWGAGAFGDDARVKELAIAARSDTVSPWAFQKALENSLIRSPGGDTIDEKVLKDNINTYSNVEQKLRAAQTGDSAKTAGISVESLLDRKYVPQTVVGYDPKSMMDLLAKNVPTVVGSREEVLQGGSEVKPVSLDMSKYPGFDMDRYVAKTIKVESSGDSTARSGSYQGLMQLDKAGVEKMGYKWDEYLKNPKLQEEAGRVWTANNIREMDKKGIPVNDLTVYMAHNQGVEGTRQILSGHPSKEIILNVLNQGISNDLPKYSNGQIDMKKVMADPNITADSLMAKYDPVNRYINKFGPKFEGAKPEMPQGGNWPRTGLGSKARLLEGAEREAALKKLNAVKSTNDSFRSILSIPARSPQEVIGDTNRGVMEPGLEDVSFMMAPVGKVVSSKIGEVVPAASKGIDRLKEMLTPAAKKPMVIEDAPKMIENLRPQGGANWVGTGRVASDKMGGVSAEDVINQASTKGNLLVGAKSNEAEARRMLDEAINTQSNKADLSYFSSMKNKADVVDKIKNETDARAFWNGVVDARSKGQISDEQVVATMRKLSDSGLISIRELMETLDKIGFRK